MTKSYILNRSRFGNSAGATVYEFSGCTYGLCGDDERATGAEHKAVTLNSDGSGPFFTVPVAYLSSPPPDVPLADRL